MADLVENFIDRSSRIARRLQPPRFRDQLSCSSCRWSSSGDPAFADVIQRDVLEPYADVRRVVEELKDHPDADGEFLAQLSRFTAVRAEGWTLLIEALRDQDREKLRRYEQKMDEAVEIARGLLEQGAQES